MNSFIKAAPGAQVWVCAKGAGGIPCSPLTPLVNISNVSISNPVTADQNGNYSFCVTTPNKYMVQIGGTGLTTVIQDGTIVPGDPQNPVITTLTVSGNTTIGGTLGVTGAATVGGLNNVLYANAFCSGSTDIDVCTMNTINSASCVGVGNKQCKVVIPNPGPTGWNAHGTITLPYQNSGSFELEIASGTIINELCTNNCDFISAIATVPENNRHTLISGGGRIIGNSQAGNCLHFRQAVGITVRDIECNGFTNKTNIIYGNGELNEGAITITNDNVWFINNNIGIQNVGYATGPGAIAPTNNVITHKGRVQVNCTGGVLENGATTGSTTANTNNSYLGDVEGNAQGCNPVTTGSLSATMVSNTVTVTGAGTATGIFAGTLLVQSGFGAGISAACVNGRFLALTATANTYTYTCVAANGTSNNGTVTGQHYQIFVESGNAIELYPTFMQWGSTPAGFEAEIEIGDSNFSPQNTSIRNVFLSSVGSTASIMLFSHANTCIDGTYEFNAVTNFVMFGTGTQGPLTFGSCNNKSFATNLFSGTPPAIMQAWDSANGFLGINKIGTTPLDINGVAQATTIRANTAGLGYSATGDTSTGFGFPGGGLTNWSSAGSLLVLLSTTELRLGSGFPMCFSSNTNPQAAGVDSCVNRSAAGVIGIGTAVGNTNGTIQSRVLLSGGAAAGTTGTGACATITTNLGGSLAGSFKCTGATAASTVTITPGTTAPNGWVCYVQDETTRANLFQQTSHNGTTCVLTATSITQNDVFVFSAIAF